MSSSLLAHLYSRIKGSQEDVATVSLQYIISSSVSLNEAFNRLMQDSLNIDIDPDTAYKCQSSGDNKERPDMSGADSSGKEIILCEMKFYAGLTSNQPNGYIDRLITNGGKGLVFVCPEQRRVSLWRRIKELCSEAGRTLSDENGYRVEVDGIAMSVISWAEIIDTLRRTASAVVKEALADIEQLAGFCAMMDSTAFIPFSSDELGPETAKKEERYYQVIDRLYDVLRANKDVTVATQGFRATPIRNGYARYLKINGYTMAILYNRAAWIKTTSVETPFWFYINENWKPSEKVEEKLRTIPEYEREMINDTKAIKAIALHAPVDALLDEIASDMMGQVLRVLDLIEK